MVILQIVTQLDNKLKFTYTKVLPGPINLYDVNRKEEITTRHG